MSFHKLSLWVSLKMFLFREKNMILLIAVSSQDLTLVVMPVFLTPRGKRRGVQGHLAYRVKFRPCSDILSKKKKRSEKRKIFTGGQLVKIESVCLKF